MAVFNAEKYLRKSLDSLRSQTLTDLQIICVDDASTDSSLAILTDYAKIDKRINVIHLNENHGQAYARNVALDSADGEFISMLDADDWLADDALEKAVKTFEQYPQTGCVLFNLRLVFQNGIEKGYDWHYNSHDSNTNDGSFAVMSGYEAFVASLDWGIHGVSMDRKELFQRFPYDATCRFYSDDNTTRLHYLNSQEVRCCSGTYYYYQHSSSVTHQVSIGRMDWMRAADSMRAQLENLKMPDKILNIWEWERWKIIIDCLWFVFVHRKNFSYEDRHHCYRDVKRAWQGVKMQRLAGKPIRKFGWFPFPHHWRLFWFEEAAYFRLRWLIGRR